MSMSQKRKSDDEAPLSYPDFLSLVRWTKGTIDVFLSEKKKRQNQFVLQKDDALPVCKNGCMGRRIKNLKDQKTV